MVVADYIRRFDIGAARVTAIDIGDAEGNPAEAFAIPEDERSQIDPQLLQRQVILPIQCFHVALPEIAILVEAGAYDLDLFGRGADYQPPPGLLATLAEVGIAADQVAHVIMSHCHWDHINGTTVQAGEHRVPFRPALRRGWPSAPSRRGRGVGTCVHDLGASGSYLAA